MGQTEHKNIKIRSRKDLEAIRERTRPLLEVERGARIVVGMGTCGLVGQIGVWTGWLAPSEEAIRNGAVAIVPGLMDWAGLILISFVLPAVLCWAFGLFFRRIGWIKEGDLTLQ